MQISREASAGSKRSVIGLDIGIIYALIVHGGEIDAPT